MTHVKVLISALLLLCLAGRDAPAQDAPAGDDARVRGRVIGLLDLPDIVGQACSASPSITADLQAAPSTTASPIGSLALRVTDRAPSGTECTATLVVRHRDGGVEPIPYRESGYEIPAAVVRARSGPWYRIDTARGSAWIRRDDPRHFLSYPDLLRNDRLTFIQKGWNASLWRIPGRGAPVLVPAAWRDIAWVQDRNQAVTVDVLEVRRIGREPWVHVRLALDSCGEDQPSMAPWTGWLPAYTKAGDTALWFYSRGC